MKATLQKMLILLLLSSCQSFTVTLLPDTQYYTEENNASTYKKQTQWIANNQSREKIKFTIHLGDITDDNDPFEWLIASEAHKILENAGAPYSVIPGNHDNPDHGEKRNTALYNNFFGVSRFTGKPGYGGHMGSTNDNNYSFFEYRKLKFMVVGLEFVPSKDALCWADKLIQQYPTHRVIIVTHCYQDHNNGYRNCNLGYNIVGSSAATLWKELIARHKNIFLVLSGHVGDSERITRTGNGSNQINEILTDYQFEKRSGESHGNGWMRTLKFYPQRNRINVKTFTVLNDVTAFNQDDYPSDPSDLVHTYPFQYDMSSAVEYEYRKGTPSFRDRTVNSDNHRQQRKPEVATAPNGDFVVVWEDDSEGAANVYQIYARGFCNGGCQNFSDITVNAKSSGQQLDPEVGMADNGSFVVVWEDDNNENNVFQIYAAGYDASGVRRFNDKAVNSSSNGQQINPDVSVGASGNFVVVWQDDNNENGVYQIYAAGFDANGNKTFGDITANSDASGQQLNPRVSMAPDGSFAVVWEDDKDKNGFYQIYAAGFDRNGVKTWGDKTVNSNSSGQQLLPDIDMGPKGNFVVVWEDDNNENKIYQIYAAGFNAGGTKTFGDISVNSNSRGQQLIPKVAMKSDGSFAVIWVDDNNENDIYQIYGTRFNANGIKQGSDFTVNENSTGQQISPGVCMNAEGNFIVVWQDDIDNNNIYEILARGLTWNMD